jgi:8-amino-7-oxononanoate synthase
MSYDKIFAQRQALLAPKAHKMRDAPVIYRNMEETLDERRKASGFILLNHAREGAIDFSSNDFLSISASGILKKLFMKELEENPGWKVGQSGSRIADGNTPYIEKLEREMAEFWRADTCLIFNSGYEANGAIFSALPHKGDVILYDDLVHASIHDGMRISRACDTAPFKHNDMDAFRSGLIMLKEKHEQLRSGRNTLIVAIESVYSMDGDYSPVEEMIAITEEIYPLGNCQFFYDEAHSTGLMGPNGRGMACALGIEKKLAVRLHTFGKAMGCNGGT